jgi:hypothetical protein
MIGENQSALAEGFVSLESILLQIEQTLKQSIALQQTSLQNLAAGIGSGFATIDVKLDNISAKLDLVNATSQALLVQLKAIYDYLLKGAPVVGIGVTPGTPTDQPKKEP